MANRPIGIDLFAGAGGLSLGFEQAGFDVPAAVEIDPIHAAVHRFNFPRSEVFPRSVAGLSGKTIREAAGIGRKAVDVVFGGPPCQGFSLIGRRMLDDPRNGLVGEFVRLVSELEARYFVFENVKGLTVGDHRKFLDSLIEEFDREGYSVRMPWRVLNASRYGVPQDRERLFLLGSKKGLPTPSYPAETSQLEAGLFRDGFVARTPSCAEALSDLPDADLFEELLACDSVTFNEWQPLSKYARECHCDSREAWHYGYRRVWESCRLTSSMRSDHTEISRRRFGATRPGEVEPISRFFKLHPDGICNTLRAGTDSARGAFTSPRPIHYSYRRCITVREMARLHGYPDWFRFHVTKWHGAREVGNSVPPPLARAVAGQIIRASGFVPQPPDKALELGDPALLEMDMRSASLFWGVAVPIGKRDRKSGARKRRQVEIEAAMSRRIEVNI